MNFLISKNWAEINAIKKQCVVQKFNRLAQGQDFLLFFHYNGSKVYNWELMKKEFSKQGMDCKGLFVPSNLHSVILEKEKRGAFPADEAEGDFQTKRIFCPKEERHLRNAKMVTNVIRDKTPDTVGVKVSKVCMQKIQRHLPFLMRGPTLIVGCSSIEQMSAIVEICTFQSNTVNVTPLRSQRSAKISGTPAFYCIGALYKNNALTHLDIKQWIFLHKLGEKKLNCAFLSLLLYQKNKSVGVFVYNQTQAIHSILHRKLMPLFLLLAHKSAGGNK